MVVSGGVGPAYSVMKGGTTEQMVTKQSADTSYPATHYCYYYKLPTDNYTLQEQQQQQLLEQQQLQQLHQQQEQHHQKEEQQWQQQQTTQSVQAPPFHRSPADDATGPVVSPPMFPWLTHGCGPVCYHYHYNPSTRTFSPVRDQTPLTSSAPSRAVTASPMAASPYSVNPSPVHTKGVATHATTTTAAQSALPQQPYSSYTARSVTPIYRSPTQPVPPPAPYPPFFDQRKLDGLADTYYPAVASTTFHSNSLHTNTVSNKLVEAAKYPVSGNVRYYYDYDYYGPCGSQAMAGQDTETDAVKKAGEGTTEIQDGRRDKGSLTSQGTPLTEQPLCMDKSMTETVDEAMEHHKDTLPEPPPPIAPPQTNLLTYTTYAPTSLTRSPIIPYAQTSPHLLPSLYGLSPLHTPRYTALPPPSQALRPLELSAQSLCYPQPLSPSPAQSLCYPQPLSPSPAQSLCYPHPLSPSPVRASSAPPGAPYAVGESRGHSLGGARRAEAQWEFCHVQLRREGAAEQSSSGACSVSTSSGDSGTPRAVVVHRVGEEGEVRVADGGAVEVKSGVNGRPTYYERRGWEGSGEGDMYLSAWGKGQLVGREDVGKTV
eukprot:GHVQ01017342.1.p1 GENE.GHVQ01017342.1~~GHVQ01017342.1.p1  ORF type:complete len:599 (-),score=135.72 GHVQ01017342.1:448-2244(-)